jgi:hypothetical protein
VNRALTLQRDHLRQHRRMLIARSLLASMVNAVPVPLLDDRLSFVVLRRMLAKIAAAHHVDLSERAFERLIFGEDDPPNPLKMAGSTLAFRLISRSWRKLLLTYMTAKRAHVAGQYFARATMFDHYCARLHVGLGLDGDSALALRRLMNQALDETPGSLGTRLFRRGLLAAARASAHAPIELFRMLGGDRLRRLLTSGDGAEEAVAVEELDVALEQQLRSQKGFLARSVTAIEFQLSVEANPYLEQLLDNFERLWRAYKEDESRA